MRLVWPRAYHPMQACLAVSVFLHARGGDTGGGVASSGGLIGLAILAHARIGSDGVSVRVASCSFRPPTPPASPPVATKNCAWYVMAFSLVRTARDGAERIDRWEACTPAGRVVSCCDCGQRRPSPGARAGQPRAARGGSPHVSRARHTPFALGARTQTHHDGASFFALARSWLTAITLAVSNYSRYILVLT